jgi:ribosomal protein L16 Arg81 hydroxylase
VAGWLKRGASLVANDVGPLSEPLRAVTRLIEEAIGCKVRANLYCSWRAHPGFATHYDTHDVYAVHLVGRKTWRIYQRQFVDPIAHAAFRNLPQEYFDRNRGAVSQEVNLEPGDLLYIPRGWYHDALATSEATMHIAFGATPVIGLDVVTHLFERAVHDPAFRAAVPRETDQAALTAHIAALGDRLAQLARDEAFVRQFAQYIASYRFSQPPIALPGDVLDSR